jgi:formylglycine-generating enzyme required for sulfatase activity
MRLKYILGSFCMLSLLHTPSGFANKTAQPTPGNVAKPAISKVMEPEMVRIPSGISMGKYEVTQAQWLSVMGNNPSTFHDCANCPVEQVSWNDAQDFIAQLNRRSGKHYRLPTEKEWETACQSGGNHEYCGSDDIDAIGWYTNNAGNSTHPVGQKQPNAFGLYDMSGNVYEWTSSCWENDCSRRVGLGGSWSLYPADARAAYRGGSSAIFFRYSGLGFRLVLD